MGCRAKFETNLDECHSNTEFHKLVKYEPETGCYVTDVIEDADPELGDMVDSKFMTTALSLYLYADVQPANYSEGFNIFLWIVIIIIMLILNLLLFLSLISCIANWKKDYTDEKKFDVELELGEEEDDMIVPDMNMSVPDISDGRRSITSKNRQSIGDDQATEMDKGSQKSSMSVSTQKAVMKYNI